MPGFRRARSKDLQPTFELPGVVEDEDGAVEDVMAETPRDPPDTPGRVYVDGVMETPRAEVYQQVITSDAE